jgi:hypothetical protein
MAMTALLTAGLADANRNIGAAVKLFWPVAAIYLVMILTAGVLGFFAALESGLALLTFTLGNLIAFLYMFIVLCQGAVGWHRRILLAETPTWASLLPRQRAFQYALAIIVLGLFLVIAHMAVGLFAAPFLYDSIASLPDINFDNAPIEQLEVRRKAEWPVEIILFLVGVGGFWVVLSLGQRWLLVYPHISVRTAQPIFREIRKSLNPPDGLITCLLIVGFLPSFVALIYGIVMPISWQIQPHIMIPMVIGSVILTAFCFLWVLSLLSIAYLAATRGKVPFAETNGSAQA